MSRTTVKNTFRNWVQLFAWVLPIQKYNRQTLVTRINLIQRLLPNTTEIDRSRFFPEGFIPLKVLTENFKGQPSLEMAIKKHRSALEFNADLLWIREDLADLNILKGLLNKSTKKQFTYTELQDLNNKAQEIRLNRAQKEI